MASPDINTEDFQAAVDCLSTREDVDPEKIGLVGICGWGGLALNTAAIDTRVKATVTSTMYDMGRVNAKGYFDQEDSEEARHAKRQALNAQRTKDYQTGTYALGGRCSGPLPEDAPFFVKDYHDYYKTNRGVSQTFPQLQRRLECHRLPVFPEPAHPAIQPRDSQRRTGHPWREGPFLLYEPGRLCQHDGRQPLSGK